MFVVFLPPRSVTQLSCQHLSPHILSIMSATKKPRVEEEPNYVPKNILITGGAGFIASHVVCIYATLVYIYYVLII
jgi:hypothetical protein